MWWYVAAAAISMVAGAAKSENLEKAAMFQPGGEVVFGGDAVTINGDGNQFTGSSTTPYINSGLDPVAFQSAAGRQPSGQIAGINTETMIAVSLAGLAVVLILRGRK